jgi:hypothetical protein
MDTYLFNPQQVLPNDGYGTLKIVAWSGIDRL